MEVNAGSERELVFIGLGLYDELDISLRGLEEARSCDRVFVELYTSVMPNFSKERLERLLAKGVTLLSRRDVEERPEEVILRHALGEKVALLTPGDPMVATTHVDLRLRAFRMGIKTRVIHSASIISAVAGATGLQAYKFGKSVTIPLYADVEGVPESVYRSIQANQSVQLHSMILLDFKAETGEFVTIPTALRGLLSLERRIGEGVLSERSLAVGVARVQAPDMIVKAGRFSELLALDFGLPPHSLVIPSRLHFVEAEALMAIGGASKDSLEGYI